jgi:hypothetical protein
VFIPAFRRGDRLPVSSQGLDLCTEPAFVSRTRDQMERAEQAAARLFAQPLRRPTVLYAGRPAKVAIVAIMRKHLILANALIRDQRK